MRVLMVHFNTPELTVRLARDFPRRTSRGRTISIHILDNCSTPQNLRSLRAKTDGMQGVTLDVSDENIGFGEGMNVLAALDVIEEADVLWLLNPDTRLQAGCLDRLEDAVDSGDFAVVSPLIYSGETDSWIWYCGGSVSTRELRVRHRLYGHGLADSPNRPFETEFVTGAAPMMRASTFRAVGGFPRGYFLYWEDVYFCWKARELGFKLGVVPAARLWHHVGASSGSEQSRTFHYWCARNRFVFASDIGIPRRRLILGHGGLESLRTVARALFVEREGRLLKASATIRGMITGFRSAR